ncbi:unnamed protein product [Paramecium octaurelia]|uniref:Uncharacterized protein n=1 Tax=Paramecium octaurelia TaxID=43137 RepID=A0A8S1W298_PAROT|nr:unnamed protein product [Paramecium octaurelia]
MFHILLNSYRINRIWQDIPLQQNYEIKRKNIDRKFSHQQSVKETILLWKWILSFRYASGVNARLYGTAHQPNFFLTQYKRINLIIHDVESNLNAFKNYLHMITVAVTIWDLCDINEREENKKAIIKKLILKQINSVLFLGWKETSESVYEQFDQIIAASKAELINLIPKDIFENFDLEDCEEDNLENVSQEELSLDYVYALTQYAKVKLEENLLNCKNNLIQLSEYKSYQIHHEHQTALFREYNRIMDYACLCTSNGNHFLNIQKNAFIVEKYGLKWLVAPDQQPVEAYLMVKRMNQQNKNRLPNNLLFSIRIKSYKLFINNYFNLLDSKHKDPNETIKVEPIGCKRSINWSDMISLTENELKNALGILDQKICDNINEQEKLYQERTEKQYAQYKKELDKKILEQRENMLQAQRYNLNIQKQFSQFIHYILCNFMMQIS